MGRSNTQMRIKGKHMLRTSSAKWRRFYKRQQRRWLRRSEENRKGYYGTLL